MVQVKGSLKDAGYFVVQVIEASGAVNEAGGDE